MTDAPWFFVSTQDGTVYGPDEHGQATVAIGSVPELVEQAAIRDDEPWPEPDEYRVQLGGPTVMKGVKA